MKNTVAVIQMVSGPDVLANLTAAARLITQAANEGAKLVLLPENFAVLDGGALDQYAEAEGDSTGMIQTLLSDLARQHGLFIVGGTMPMSTRPVADGDVPAQTVTIGKVRPASLVFNPQGNQIARYDKIHLFDVTVADKQAQYSESRSFEPGTTPVCISTPFGKLGLSVCYDLRFPELYRQLLREGAEILTVPSAFTAVTGAAHWEVLLRARAIENQCYVLAANQGGVHNSSRETFGHSMIVDPWGKVLACIEKGEGVAIAELDMDMLHELRERMPVQQHQRIR